MLRFLWPQERSTEPALAAGVGRLAHWAGLILALLWLAACCWMAMTHPRADWSDGYLIGMFIVPPLSFYAGGRAARWFLAGE